MTQNEGIAVAEKKEVKSKRMRIMTEDQLNPDDLKRNPIIKNGYSE